MNSEEEELHLKSIEIPSEKETPILDIQKSEGDRNDVKDIESLEEEELGIIDNLDLIEDELHFERSEAPFDQVNCVSKSEIKNTEDIKGQISDQNYSPNSKKEVRIDAPLPLQAYDQRTRIQQSNESFDPSTLNSDEAINYLNQIVQSVDEHSKHKNKDSLLKTIQEEENSNKEQTGIPATRFENNSIESIHSQAPDTNQLVKEGFDNEIIPVHDSDIHFIEENFDDYVEEEDFENENNIKDQPISEQEEKNQPILPKDAQNDLSPSEMPKMDIPELLIEDSAKPILAGKENTNTEVLENPQEKPTEYILSEMIIEYDEHYSMITVEDPNKSVVMNDQINEYVYEEEYEYVSDQFIEEIVEYDEEYTGIPEDND